MLVRIVRGLVRVSVGLALGAVPGALYGIAVGTVHLGVYGRWDRAPAFAVGCVLVGALFGLLGASSGPCPARPHPATSSCHWPAVRPRPLSPYLPDDRAAPRPAGRGVSTLVGQGDALRETGGDGPPSRAGETVAAGGCVVVAVLRRCGGYAVRAVLMGDHPSVLLIVQLEQGPAADQ